MNRLLIILSIVLSVTTFAQEINKKDAAGKKQGVWKKAYTNVKVYKYVGQFKDDYPFGKFV